MDSLRQLSVNIGDVTYSSNSVCLSGRPLRDRVPVRPFFVILVKTPGPQTHLGEMT